MSKASNVHYERTDHLFRADDHYANGKYRVTVRWLGRARLGEGVLANVGCGAGDFNQFAREGGASRVRAWEPSEWTCRVARDRFAGQAWCEIGQKGVFELTAEDFRDVETVVMHDVLEHIEDDRAAVRKLAEVMPAGTDFVISVPALQALFGRHDEELAHFRRYTLGQLVALLEPYFEIRKKRYYGFFFLPVTWTLSVWLRKPYPQPAGASLVSRIVRILCAIEERVAFPLGTAVIVWARRKG